MPGVVVHSVYKPPNNQFELPTLGQTDLPHIVIGDFNSHSTPWSYDTLDKNREAVEQWADSCGLTLIHDAHVVYEDDLCNIYRNGIQPEEAPRSNDLRSFGFVGCI